MPPSSDQHRQTAPIAGTPKGFGWAELVDGLVAREGSLAAVARLLAESRGYAENLDTVERGLRRLRHRGQTEGGNWGRRVLQRFGLPSAVLDRVRWMGLYHGRFTDLPRSLCTELLRPWDRPPVSESPARVWVQLGQASLCIKARDREGAEARLDQARLAAPQAGPGARVELGLVRSYLISRERPDEARDLLAEAEVALGEVPAEEAEDAACWRARLVDQKAYRLNRPPPGEAPDPAAALALYAALPERGVPPFALCRRENGMAWSAFGLGDREAAIRHARRSLSEAGDSGSLRLRAMALSALGRFLGEDSAEGADCRRRARAIARRLEDEALALRFSGPR